MARNRIIYQSEALFSSVKSGDAAGNVASSLVTNLQRVTEISNNTEVARENVNVFGRLASISREIIEEPTVSMDFTYYLADGFNESGIGLTTYRNAGNQHVNCLSGILANSPEANRNFYVLTVEEGVDANGINPHDAAYVGKLGIIGLGNGTISNYTVNGAVGEIPNASVSVEASNISFNLSAEAGFQNPSIDVTSSVVAQLTGLVQLPTPTTGTLTVKALRPGDIVLDFGTGSFDMGGAVMPGMTSADTKQSAHIQSFSIDLPLSRTPQKRLGNAFAFSRELDVPIDVTLNVSANLADVDQGSLVDLICAGSAERDIVVKLYGPCGNDGTESELNMMYTLKGATLDTQNLASTIGDSKTVELTFTSQVGGPNDATKGLFISGRR
jgi:hypothetical protein